MRLFLSLLIVFCILFLSACELLELQPVDTSEHPYRPFESENSEASESQSTEIIPSERYTVVFDENEIFSSDTDKKAAERIDFAIITAVKLMNTIEEKPIKILDCDYDARPKQRDALKYSLSKDLYDEMLNKVSAFEDYHFSQNDHIGVDLFNIFVSALDALRIDHTDLFLYCDGVIDNTEYRSGYFMPGDNLSSLCDDREAIRAEVELCNAVVNRIVDKMPAGLSNYEKCCYFALVLSAGNEYDYSDNIPLYDYPAYSALVKGQAICSGYAQAFYRLCREAGISCWYCRGNTPYGRHAWNILDTESGPVYMDITWYDTENIRDNYRDGKEMYLFMTQEDFDYYGYIQDSCQ